MDDTNKNKNEGKNENDNKISCDDQMEKSPKQQAGYWSTCAYLINKAVMKPILDQIWTVSSKTQIFIFFIIYIKQPFHVLILKRKIMVHRHYRMKKYTVQ